MPNNDKKVDHNTSVGDGIKKFFMKNLIKNLKNGALSRNLIKSIKKYFIKNLIKNLKKAPYHVQSSTLSKKHFIKELKPPYHKT